MANPVTVHGKWTTGAVVRLLVIIAIALFLLIVVFNSVVVIQSGTVGVVSTLGAVQDQPLRQGLHFKMPFLQNVEKINVKTLLLEADCSAASKDLQTISSRVALNFHVAIDTAPQLLKGVGTTYQSVIIAPAIQESVKAGTAKFSAEELITKRQEVSSSIRDELTTRLQGHGIVVDTFNITNLDFSQAFNASIEAKQIAQQDALRAEQELNKVKIEAQQQVEKAKAEADATRARADAEAYAIQKVQEQLAKNPAYIDYKKIEKWDGKLPQVQGSSSPIIDLREGETK